jgi:hypothetical protein
MPETPASVQWRASSLHSLANATIALREVRLPLMVTKLSNKSPPGNPVQHATDSSRPVCQIRTGAGDLQCRVQLLSSKPSTESRSRTALLATSTSSMALATAEMSFLLAAIAI